MAQQEHGAKGKFSSIFIENRTHSAEHAFSHINMLPASLGRTGWQDGSWNGQAPISGEVITLVESISDLIISGESFIILYMGMEQWCSTTTSSG
jgi:hypothetical protein